MNTILPSALTSAGVVGKQMNKLKELFQPRCKHRHTATTHPSCFVNGQTLEKAVKNGDFPKVLLIDIETLPMEVRVWNLGEQRISPHNVIKDFSIVTWAAKWLFEDRVMSEAVTSKEAIDREDYSVLQGMWNLLNEADLVIAHNGNGFDFPKLNTRFIINGFNPPMYYRTIDTLQVARKVFKFSSNQLDYINKLLGLRRKESSVGLWDLCVEGDVKAISDMQTYNMADVFALEDAYLTLRPWMQNHPNLGVFVETEDTVCPKCTHKISEDNWTSQYYTTNTGKYRGFRCNCGAIGRSGVNEIKKNKAKELARG